MACPRLIRTMWPIVLAAIMTAGCAGLPRYDPPKVSVVGIDALPGQGLEVRMAVKLRVINPNEKAIDYDGVYIALDMQGVNFANGVSDQKGQVPRFGETVIDVPVSISAMAMLRQAVALSGRDPAAPMAYELHGKLAGPAFDSFRFNARGEFVVPRPTAGHAQP